MATEFFSHDDIDQIYIGYSSLAKIIFPKKEIKKKYFAPEITKLLRLAQKTNETEFNKLINRLDTQNTVQDSIFNFAINKNWFDFFDYVKKFYNFEIDSIASDYPKEECIMVNDLLIYGHTVELDWIYKVLFDCIYIIENKPIEENFNVNEYYQLNNGIFTRINRNKELDSPLEKLYWLLHHSLTKTISKKLIQSVNNRLRNAIYHSQYKLISNKIILTNYKTPKNRPRTISYESFLKKLEIIESYKADLTSLLADFKLDIYSKKKVVNKSKSLFLPISEDNQTKEKYVRISFSLYWDQILNIIKNKKSLDAEIKLTVNKKTNKITVLFNKREFKGEVNDSIKDLMEKGKMLIAIDIIAPNIPFFKDLMIGWFKTDGDKYMLNIGTFFINNDEHNKKLMESLKKRFSEIY